MNKKSRRQVLKGLAVTAPVAWATPVVESVILPAHGATTDVPVPVVCSAEPGCYEGFITGEGGPFNVMWPGGPGANDDVQYWTGDTVEKRTCQGDPTSMGSMAIAGSPDEARVLLGCSAEVLELVVVNTNCSIWECCTGCNGGV